MIIAIDGPAASGKGTLARRLAAHYGLPHLDTGALYRAVARDAVALNVDLDDARAAAKVAAQIDPASLSDLALRSEGVGEMASVVARHGEVRAALLSYQQAFAHRAPGAVLDGRDVGTVVCPDADVKLFITASDEARANRRWRELRGDGVDISLSAVLDDIRARDRRDTERASAPLRQAADAYLLDTTKLDIEAAFKAAVDIVDAATNRSGRVS